MDSYKLEGAERLRSEFSEAWVADIDGKLCYHREDGPAIIWKDGRVDWAQKNQFHREDGPACTYPGGEAYYYFGNFHREDGPATSYGRWCLYGRTITEEVSFWMDECSIEKDHTKWTAYEVLLFLLRFSEFK